jgi:hypothetical protein
LRARRRLLSGLAAAILVLLGVVIGILVNIVSSYPCLAVTRGRPLRIGLLAGGAAMFILSWLVGRPARTSLSQVPPVTGRADSAELTEVLSVLTSKSVGAQVSRRLIVRLLRRLASGSGVRS